MLRVALAVCAVLSLAGGADAQSRPVCKNGNCSGLTSGYSIAPTYQAAPVYVQPYQSAPVVIQSGKVSAAAAWSGACCQSCTCAENVAKASAVTQSAPVQVVQQQYSQSSYAAFASESCSSGSGFRGRSHPVLSRIPFIRRLVRDE